MNRWRRRSQKRAEYSSPVGSLDRAIVFDVRSVAAYNVTSTMTTIPTKHESLFPAYALLMIGVIGAATMIWLSPTDQEKQQTPEAKTQAETEYKEAQETVLEDLAGMIPESQTNLSVIQRDGRTIRVNRRSGAWCILIENPSNPLPYFSCSEIDKRAQRVREEKSLSNRIRHFFHKQQS